MWNCRAIASIEHLDAFSTCRGQLSVLAAEVRPRLSVLFRGIH